MRDIEDEDVCAVRNAVVLFYTNKIAYCIENNIESINLMRLQNSITAVVDDEDIRREME